MCVCVRGGGLGRRPRAPRCVGLGWGRTLVYEHGLAEAPRPIHPPRRLPPPHPPTLTGATPCPAGARWCTSTAWQRRRATPTNPGTWSTSSSSRTVRSGLFCVWGGERGREACGTWDMVNFRFIAHGGLRGVARGRPTAQSSRRPGQPAGARAGPAQPAVRTATHAHTLAAPVHAPPPKQSARRPRCLLLSPRPRAS